MADELISRQAAKDKLAFMKPYFRAYGVDKYLDDLIDEIPAVDAVEVVRCKDCKYSMLWRKPTAKAVGDCWIRKMNSEDEQFALVDAEDFCSMGKRREENAAD